jgi:hypothetical protein
MIQQKDLEKEIQQTDSKTPHPGIFQPLPTASVTHGTRALWKYDKKRGWTLEYYGDKVAIRRALKDPPATIRRRKKEKERLRFKMLAESISTVLERAIKVCRGY